MKRINPDGVSDVLEFGRAEVADSEIQPTLDLPIGVLGETNRARLRDAFQPRGDLDSIAHQVAVGLFDHVAEMNANSKFDPPVLIHAGVALSHAALNFDRAAHGVDHTAELDDRSVAGALDDAAAMGGDRGINQIAAEAPKARKRALLVGAGEPAIAHDVSNQNRC